ncbi:MAG: branched-chain alpha-keto acid dehydrogenase subunit [Nocardioidaceae bacterium]|nr:branched-chain alpha-keto acid dehydrogenase subunit [Nocardioidaceae bacterium]
MEFRLPDVGEGLTEAEIITWKVAVGDTVKVNDPLLDIETAKSIVELPSPYAGVVTRLGVAEGQTVPVGTVLLTLAGAEAIEDSPSLEARTPVLVGYGPRARSRTSRVRRPRASEPSRPAQPSGRILAKPPVRKLAKDLGIDLDALPNNGEIITRADVEAYASAHRAGTETRVSVRGVRKATAAAMVESASSAPQVTEWIDVDVSRTVEFVGRMKSEPATAHVKAFHVIVRAVCLALRRTPELNGHWDEAAQEIVLPHAIGLGIAVATPRGLIVPTIPDAGAMSLPKLSTSIIELATTARSGTMQPAQMTGGTFTVTNIGVFGVDGGTPLLSPGQAGILAVGQIARRPWLADDGETIVARDVATLALTFDHRVVDGAEASRFLSDVAAIARDPAMSLAF